MASVPGQKQRRAAAVQIRFTPLPLAGKAPLDIKPVSVHTKNGPPNSAMVKHAGFNITQTTCEKVSPKVGRKTIGWDNDDFELALGDPRTGCSALQAFPVNPPSKRGCALQVGCADGLTTPCSASVQLAWARTGLSTGCTSVPPQTGDQDPAGSRPWGFACPG
jgi:hypothetical protein